ncbi:hypothetical protein [Polaribacter gochangensis]|uniref:hypothetical protein n=1 Tax=Polaribacter gochangensis TaxID=3252903 RepID=UPI003904AC09
MKKYVSLILAIIIIIDVIVSFVKDKGVENVFGIEMHIWVYRFLWSLLAFLLIKGFLKELKNKKTTRN